MSDMATINLPLEIQQQIYSLLDSKSFHNARRVSRWWRFSSMSSMAFSQQVGKLPMHPVPDVQATNPQHLHALFNKAARTLLFGLGVTADSENSSILQPAWKLPGRPPQASSSDGKKLVTLDDRTATLFDTSGPRPRAIQQKQLHDLRDLPIGHASLRARPSAQHRLALSSEGRLLAVAMDRTIQIYDLHVCDSEQGAATRHMADGSGRRIRALGFERDDYVRRVQLSGDGAELYLGSPRENCGTKAEMRHWQGRRRTETQLREQCAADARSRRWFEFPPSPACSCCGHSATGTCSARSAVAVVVGVAATF